MLNFNLIKLIKFLLILFLINTQYTNAQTKESTTESNDVTITLLDQPVLLVSTLDGTLYALEKHTGKIKWKIKEEPLVKLPGN